MESLINIFQIIATVAGALAMLMSVFLFLRLQWPASAWWFVKLFNSTLSPWLIVEGTPFTIRGLTIKLHKNESGAAEESLESEATRIRITS